MQAKGKMWQSRPVVETQNVCGSSFWFTYWKTGREKFASFMDLLLRLQSKSLNICTAKYCFSWKQKCDEFCPGKNKHNGTLKKKNWRRRGLVFMQPVWATALILITIFHHTCDDFGAATVSGLIQTADSIFPFMLSLFHVTVKVPGEIYWWTQSYFQSSYKHFLDNEISTMLFLWFFGAQIVIAKTVIRFIDLLSRIN